MTVAIAFSRPDQLLDFGFRQMLTLAVVRIRSATRSNCSLFA
jgi:NADH:ubiquinone oxidoreductase subunit H